MGVEVGVGVFVAVGVGVGVDVGVAAVVQLATSNTIMGTSAQRADRGGLVCLNSAARFDKWNHAAVR